MTAQDLVKSLLDAHLSSQEEAIFGEFLEGLAIFINEKVYGGYKSSAEGIDLEFKKDDVHYIITIKSGPNWGNSSQIKKMLDNFRRAKRVLGTSIDKTKIAAINGCCYGIDNSPEKEEYSKLCGQRFWEFISGDGELYTKIIKPIGHQAKERNSKFMEKYTQIINIFTFEFGKEFCKEGIIEWKKLVDFNSGKSK